MEAIRTHGLTKKYGRRVALHELDLEVSRGTVFGYLGPNGAGKTTTIRLLMGLLGPSAGSAEVMGLDVITERERVHALVGYLPGDFVAYRDLLGSEFLRYLGSLRGGVDWNYVELIAKRFDLDLERRIGELSHGNRQKVGLIQAFMHRPQLLILDEPTTGLDPLMQQEFLALVREVRDEGSTVFLSSHVLDEVEHVADRVGMLRGGRLLMAETVESLKGKALRHIDLSFENVPASLRELRRASGVRSIDLIGTVAHVVVEGSTSELLRVAAQYGIENVVTHEADLEQIFLSYYEAGNDVS